MGVLREVDGRCHSAKFASISGCLNNLERFMRS
jgi:hypothetical protein